MYSPELSRDKVNQELSKLRKINYNRFKWWRMYTPINPPLHARKSLRDRILNGDFDYSHYRYQALWCEYQMNDLWEECKGDVTKYIEKSSLLRTRRKRLFEDFIKDENEKLDLLIKEFTRYFKCDKEQVYQCIEECGGDLIDLYYIIEEKYKIYNKPYKPSYAS